VGFVCPSHKSEVGKPGAPFSKIVPGSPSSAAPGPMPPAAVSADKVELSIT